MYTIVSFLLAITTWTRWSYTEWYTDGTILLQVGGKLVCPLISLLRIASYERVSVFIALVQHSLSEMSNWSCVRQRNYSIISVNRSISWEEKQTLVWTPRTPCRNCVSRSRSNHLLLGRMPVSPSRYFMKIDHNVWSNTADWKKEKPRQFQ